MLRPCCGCALLCWIKTADQAARRRAAGLYAPLQRQGESRGQRVPERKWAGTGTGSLPTCSRSSPGSVDDAPGQVHRGAASSCATSAATTPSAVAAASSAAVLRSATAMGCRSAGPVAAAKGRVSCQRSSRRGQQQRGTSAHNGHQQTTGLCGRRYTWWLSEWACCSGGGRWCCGDSASGEAP